jgi:hypothetical protein
MVSVTQGRTSSLPDQASPWRRSRTTRSTPSYSVISLGAESACSARMVTGMPAGMRR